MYRLHKVRVETVNVIDKAVSQVCKCKVDKKVAANTMGDDIKLCTSSNSFVRINESILNLFRKMYVHGLLY